MGLIPLTAMVRKDLQLAARISQIPVLDDCSGTQKRAPLRLIIGEILAGQLRRQRLCVKRWRSLISQYPCFAAEVAIGMEDRILHESEAIPRKRPRNDV